ncbi:hypothetical protein [Candidatus Deferrimicrobium sp.]|uniref:hypothetical protein n=1 Tax=Candidatus Deferrimicrobium sp. TaxID=3060586 RepID=UPI002ED10BD5
MRKALTVILTVLLLAGYIPPPIAKAETGLVIDARFLKIKMIVDGIPENSSMVVNLTVGYDKKDDFKWATWDSIFIMSDSVGGGERVILRPDHYETGVPPNSGRIRNLIVSKNTVTFDLIRSIDRPVHIVCVKRGENDYDFRGTSTYYSDIMKRSMTEEWVLTDKIILESKEVFGFPDQVEKAPKKRK